MNRRRLFAMTGIVVLLAACSTAQTSGFLQSNGVSQPAADRVGTVSSQLFGDATLFCLVNGIVAAVPGVLVRGATSASVANACAQAQLVGGAIAATVPVPVPPPVTPTPVPVATTPPLVAAAVAASVKPASN